MEHMFARVWENLILRISGPMKFRLVLQPAMAIFFAIRGGLKDARDGKPAYFWALFSDPGERRSMLENGWKAIGKVFILAILLDVIYQIIVQRWVYPGEAVLVAIILAILPYLLIRGPVNRIARRSHKAVKERLAGD
ncbi:MAG: hypothetical protein WA826_11800 [Silvibacterium sp.]